MYTAAVVAPAAVLLAFGVYRWRAGSQPLVTRYAAGAAAASTLTLFSYAALAYWRRRRQVDLATNCCSPLSRNALSHICLSSTHAHNFEKIICHWAKLSNETLQVLMITYNPGRSRTITICHTYLQDSSTMSNSIAGGCCLSCCRKRKKEKSAANGGANYMRINDEVNGCL
jgi:hypothetical protein